MKNTSYLNYRQLNKDNLDQILRTAYQYTASEHDLANMLAQFDSYSKDDSGTTKFKPDGNEKRKQVTPAMREAAELNLMAHFQQLEASENNLNRVLV
jgi:hypothetical protein